MNSLIIFASCLLAVASANPGFAGLYAGAYATPYATPYAVPYAASVSNQYHAQDELGQYSYGYSGGPSAKTESRTADGITRGGYSYVDANGIVQSTSYVSDPINGFRVAATNLPVAPVAAAVPAVHAVAAPVAVVDTPEVVAAKAVHFQAHAAAKAGHYVAAAAPLAYAHAAPLAYAHAAPIALATEARLVDPVAIAAGAPLPTGDTVEVAAAKAAHFQAHAIAKSNHFLRYKRGLGYAAPLAYAAYAPRNFGYSSVTAHAAPLAYSGYSAPLAYSGYAHAAPLAYAAAPAVALATEARQIDPVAIAAGAPLPTGDTVEVAAAKAAHLQVHAQETARNYGLYAHAAPLAYSSYAHAAPVAYAGWNAPLAYAHAAPAVALATEARQIDPVAIAAGAPLPTGDTVEVAAAKAAHLQAHATARATHGAFY